MPRTRPCALPLQKRVQLLRGCDVVKRWRGNRLAEAVSEEGRSRGRAARNSGRVMLYHVLPSQSKCGMITLSAGAESADGCLLRDERSEGSEWPTWLAFPSSGRRLGLRVTAP